RTVTYPMLWFRYISEMNPRRWIKAGPSPAGLVAFSLLFACLKRIFGGSQLPLYTLFTYL
ncbi:MAG: hypothetical protein PVF32_14445, partial [Desulfobacterales bacterium]